MPDGSASLVTRKRFSGERHPPDGAIFPCGADHAVGARPRAHGDTLRGEIQTLRSEEHTSELQSLMRISYAVFCLKKKKKRQETKSKPNTIIRTQPRPETRNEQVERQQEYDTSDRT